MVTILKKGTPIDEMSKQVDALVSKSPKKDILKYAGKLKTSIDPLEFQKKMRDEWE
jgi:hypothetical protein